MYANISPALAAEHVRSLRAQATADGLARQARQARKERRTRHSQVRHEITASRPQTATCEPSVRHA